MGGVAEQNQAAGKPAPTSDAADGINQQVVERRHPLQQVSCGGKDPPPLLAEGPKVASSYRVSRTRHMGCSPKVDEVAAQRCLAEGSQWGPVLLEPRADLTPNNRAYIAAPQRHPAPEASCAAHGRIDSVGTHDDVGPQPGRASVQTVLRSGSDRYRSAWVGAHRGPSKTCVNRGHAGDGVKQQLVKVGATDRDRVIKPAA